MTTLNPDTLDSLLNQVSIMEKEHRNMAAQLAAMRAQLEALRPKPEAQDVSAVWCDLYPKIFYRESDPPMPTQTKRDGKRFIVTVPPDKLDYFTLGREPLQDALNRRLPEPVNLVFEAEPHEATSDTTPPAPSDKPDPGESEGVPPDTSEQPEPEPAEVAGTLEALTAELKTHGISEIVAISESLGGFCFVVDKKYEELALKFPRGKVRINARMNGRTELYIMGIPRVDPQPEPKERPRLENIPGGAGLLTAQAGEAS